MNTSNRNRPEAHVLRRINWPLVAGLSVVALVRPLFSIAGLSDAFGRPATPLALTAAISLVWILSVGLSRVREPLLTLVAAGLGYGVASILLSAIVSPLLTGHLEGPIARPIAIIPALAVNAIWGVICGALALALQHARGVRP